MIFLRFALLFLLFSSCTQAANRKEDQESQNEARKKVLCTTAMIGNIVEEVGGSHVAVTTLITGEHDPHSYRLVKGDDEKFQEADLIFYNGLGLEHGPSLKAILEKTSMAYAMGSFLEHQMPSKLIVLGNVYDPHIWMDIELWSQCVPFIADILIKELPAAREDIEKNRDALLAKMQAIHQKIVHDFQAIPREKRYLVTTHDAFQYFARAYLADPKERENGTWVERVAAPEGLAPESQLSTVDIVNVVDYMMRFNVRVLFAESNVSRDSIKKIMDAASKRGFDVSIVAKPLYADSMGPKNSEAAEYLGMMQYDAQVIQSEIAK